MYNAPLPKAQLAHSLPASHTHHHRLQAAGVEAEATGGGVCSLLFGCVVLLIVYLQLLVQHIPPCESALVVVVVFEKGRLLGIEWLALGLTGAFAFAFGFRLCCRFFGLIHSVGSSRGRGGRGCAFLWLFGSWRICCELLELLFEALNFAEVGTFY
jgi:hypothetical protein